MVGHVLKGPVAEERLAVMMEAIMGPGDEAAAATASSGVDLGAVCRKGMKCFYRESGLAIVAYGESYDPQDGAMAEIVRDLYRRHGEDCVKHIEGQFSFCVWDDAQKKLLLAVDRFGTNAIYYYERGGLLIFGSRLKSVLGSGLFSASVDANAIYNYLTFTFVPTPRTAYNEVKKLPAGCIISARGSGIRIKRYWDVRYRPDYGRSEKYFCQSIPSIMEEAVRKRFDNVSERSRTGAFLSGGLDSSVVCGMMRKISGTDIKAFSVGFEEKDYNEIPYAEIVTEHFGLNLHRFIIKPTDLMPATEILLDSYDEPYGNPSAVAAYYCMKQAKEAGVDIMLSGDGGDENFAGYDRYQQDQAYSFYRAMPRALRKKVIEPFAGVIPIKKLKNYISHANIPAPERFFFYNLYPMYERSAILSDDFLDKIDPFAPKRVLEGVYGESDAAEELSRFTYLDTKLALVDNDIQGKIENIAGILGVRARYPMIDTRLWEEGGRIPAALKVKGLQKKYIYKKAFTGFLPRVVINKKKHGFGMPLSIWFHKDPEVRKTIKDVLLDPCVHRRGIFRKGFFEKMLALYDSQKIGYYSNILWVFLMLELWYAKKAGRA